MVKYIKYGKKSKNMANPGKSQNPGKIYGMTPKTRQMPEKPGNLGTLTLIYFGGNVP